MLVSEALDVGSERVRLAQRINEVCERQLREKMTSNGVLHPYAADIIAGFGKTDWANIAGRPWLLQAHLDAWIRVFTTARLEMSFLQILTSEFPGWLVHPADFERFCCQFVAKLSDGLHRADYLQIIDTICRVSDTRQDQWSLAKWFHNFICSYGGPARREFIRQFEEQFMSLAQVLDGNFYGRMAQFLYRELSP